jgi:RNA polymerase sigma-70 factor (ECF subfamily)
MKDNLSIASYREYLFNYLKKKFPSSRREDIEDVVQNALIKALRFSEHWKKDCSLKTWLCVIAHNMYLDSLRKTYIKNEYLLSTDEDLFLFENITVDDFSNDIISEDNHSELVDRLFFDYAENVHIQAFKLSVIDEIDYKEISEKYNIPMGTIKSRVFRGKKILLERYNQKLESERF